MPLFNWTLRDPLFASSSIQDMAWSAAQNQWVAVGTQNHISTSPDGITWTQRTSPFVQYDPSQYSFRSVEYSPTVNRWVAIEGNGWGWAYSTDGITWTLGNLANINTTFNIRKVVWGAQDAIFVLTGGDDNVKGIQTSTDGLNWTVRNAQFGVRDVLGVNYSAAEARWVCVGSSDTLHRGISQSINGAVTWSQVTTLPITQPSLRDVTYNPVIGAWIVAGSQNYISFDGLATWTNLTLTLLNQLPAGGGSPLYIFSAETWNGITFLTGGYYTSPSGRYRGCVFTSTDGLTWTFDNALSFTGNDTYTFNSAYNPTAKMYMLGGSLDYLATGIIRIPYGAASMTWKAGDK